MKGVHEIYRDQGDQQLVHIPPVRVTSAEYIIEDLAEGESSADRVIASGAATIDALSESIAADSGRGTTSPRRIAVAGSTALRARTYALEENGETEIVTLEGVTPNAVITDSPVSAAYTDAGQLRGVEVSATFPGAAAADENRQEDDHPLRVIWTYTIDSRLVRVREQIRLRRVASDQAYLGQMVKAVRRDWPELVQALPKEANAVRTLVRSCSDFVVARLMARGINADAFLAGRQGFQVLMSRVLWRFGERGHSPGGTDLEEWRNEQKNNFRSAWRQLVVGNPGVDTADVDQRTDEAPHGRSRRRGNLVRPM